jgi:hypothetical protein
VGYAENTYVAIENKEEETEEENEA